MKVPDPPPDGDGKAAARKAAEQHLADAALALKQGRVEDARKAHDLAVQADPTTPMVADIGRQVRQAEERAKAKAEVEGFLRDAAAREPKDAILLVEKAIEVAKAAELATVGELESRLAELRVRADKFTRFRELLDKAAKAPDPVDAIRYLDEAVEIAPPDQVTAVSTLKDKRRSEVADKHAQEGQRLEGLKQLEDARQSYAKALEFSATHVPAQEGLQRVNRLVPPGMAWVPAGPFLYGEKNEEANADGFYLQKREVTVAEWEQFLEASRAAGTEIPAPKSWVGGKPPEGSGVLAMQGITWSAASAYAAWKGAGWRIPTEREWERGARGVDGRIYPWGNAFAAGKANVARHSPGVMAPGSLAGDVSPTGCFDMAGNVMEWTSSDYDTTKSIYKGVKTLRGGRYDSSEKAAILTTRTPGIGADALEAGLRLAWSPP